MKLLIVTQVLDKNHPILGFFHRWVEEFAKHCERVHVICLEEGEHNLSSNVIVHSLGKEKGNGKIAYIFNFYRLIFSLRKEYDGVLVHMNQIYVILGAPFWHAFGKKVGLWYAHGSTPLTLKIAEKMTNAIFTCSEDSFKIKSKKVIVTGHGIDTDSFFPQVVPRDIDLITVGRITDSKNLVTLIEILREIRVTHKVKLTVVGAAVTQSEKLYEKRLRELVEKYNLTDTVDFVGKVSQGSLPMMLSRAKIFVTVAQNGSLDKAILEAMACGLSVVSMAPGSKSLLLGDGQVATKEVFALEVKKVLESEIFEKRGYAVYVQSEHSLTALVPKIIKILS